MPRLGTHVSSAGGVLLAAERAHALGCDTLQVFTASPRQWHAAAIAPGVGVEMSRLRRKWKLRPLVVHANYLINLAGENREFHARSTKAFRAELERAAAVEAEYLVLHPGSGEVSRCVESIRGAVEGFAWGGLTLLIENMAGGGNHLGGSFAAVAELLDGLSGLPVGACIDTCHSWASGVDLVTPEGYAAALRELDRTVGLKRVPVFHTNDAKTERASHHDRHAHIGAGKLGLATFQRLLQDRRLRGKAFIVETPPDGQAADLAALRRLSS